MGKVNIYYDSIYNILFHIGKPGGSTQQIKGHLQTRALTAAFLFFLNLVEHHILCIESV